MASDPSKPDYIIDPADPLDPDDRGRPYERWDSSNKLVEREPLSDL